MSAVGSPRFYGRVSGAVGAVLLIWGVSAPDVAAQSGWTFPNDALFDAIQAFYYGVSGAINDRISVAAEVIFGVCASIQAALYFWNLMLEQVTRRPGGVKQVILRLMRYTIFIALGAWLLANDDTLTNQFEVILLNNIAPYILDGTGYDQVASPQRPIGASEIVDVGWYTYEQVNENAMAVIAGPSTVRDTSSSDSTSSGSGSSGPDDDDIFSTISGFLDTAANEVEDVWEGVSSGAQVLINMIFHPTLFVVWLATLLVIPTFYVIAFQVVTTNIIIAFLGGFMPLFLAFLPLSFLSPIVDGYVRYYLFTVFKLFFIYLFLIPLMVVPDIIFALMGTGGSPPPEAPLDLFSDLRPTTFSFSNYSPPSDAESFYQRVDFSLILTGLVLAMAGIIKTAPSKLARYVTGQFTIRPIYEIVED